MDYIFITLKIPGRDEVDLKVPTFITIAELISIIKQSLKLEQIKLQSLQAEPLGKILQSDQTLNQENVLNGALLTLI